MVVARHGPPYDALRKEIRVSVHGFGEHPLDIHEHPLNRNARVALGASERPHYWLERRWHPTASAMSVAQRRHEVDA